MQNLAREASRILIHLYKSLNFHFFKFQVIYLGAQKIKNLYNFIENKKKVLLLYQKGKNMY